MGQDQLHDEPETLTCLDIDKDPIDRWLGLMVVLVRIGFNKKWRESYFEKTIIRKTKRINVIK